MEFTTKKGSLGVMLSISVLCYVMAIFIMFSVAGSLGDFFIFIAFFIALGSIFLALFLFQKKRKLYVGEDLIGVNGINVNWRDIKKVTKTITVHKILFIIPINKIEEISLCYIESSVEKKLKIKNTHRINQYENFKKEFVKRLPEGIEIDQKKWVIGHI